MAFKKPLRITCKKIKIKQLKKFLLQTQLQVRIYHMAISYRIYKQ